jgi:two-component system CheB/CheR fusion protein
MVTRKGARRVAAEAPTGFPIVGLGASAGGLEAFEHFFRNVPPGIGMAFVLVPHLDPGHASILTEILQRSTAMPVAEAQDSMPVAPNGVYVIPPNRDMAIFHGVIQLSVPAQPRGHRMPIDAFLRSLAEDQGERAIGVILSGTGTDGTLGLRAILGAGGVSFVQDPATAKYDGMPLSAIQAGYATYVLPVGKMPEAMHTGARNLAVSQESPPTGGSSLDRILMMLRSGTGNDFSQYKKTTIGRRIARRMSLHDIENTEVYARYLSEHPPEVQSLFKELLINVTSFFRDPEAFAALKNDVLPQMFAGKPQGYVFRVWVAGCATGEETYSIAILMHEFMAETGQDFKVQFYSTDLDEDAIGVARAATYPPNIVQDVLPERLLRFFVKGEAGYRVKKEIREMVVFAIQNVIKDPPFTRLDLVSCRNLMIYLEPELQERLIRAFHYALKPGGVLFLSPSESIGDHNDLFAPLSRKWKLYRATHSVAATRGVTPVAPSRSAESDDKPQDEPVKITKEIHFAELTKRVLLQSYAPASVVTDMKGNILYVHGDTGKYLRPAPGQATLNAVEMARDFLQAELSAAVHRAGSRSAPTVSRELSVEADGDHRTVSFSVRPLADPDAGEGLLLLSFQDMARAAPDKPARGKRASGGVDTGRIEELERDLAYTKENLHATIEEQQASNEELKSTNEEMQSTNEELQSTNEELETSKEELQSVNEELVTVNAELETKIEQLANMQNDMKNLLDNINVGTVFLDEHLVIRNFTPEAARVYHLVSADLGRSLSDIKSELVGADLLAEAQAVIETLTPFEREVHTTGGASYLARIQPYRTLDNVIEGVVMTFVPLTDFRQMQEDLLVARELAESIVDTVREPLIVVDGALRVVSASRSFYQRFHVAPEETVGRLLYDLGNRQWDIPALRELLETVLPRHRSFDAFPVEHEFPAIGRCRMLVSARRVVGTTGETQLILLAIEMASPGE